MRTGVRGSPARCSLHPSLGAAALALPIPAFPRSAERHRGWGLTAGLPQEPNGMNGTEPGNRGRGRDRRESPYALGSAGQQDSRTARQRRQPGAKVSWDKFRGGGRSGPVLRQKTERTLALPGVGFLGLRLPVPSRSRLSLIPMALVLPVACSQISLLFLHGDPPQGKGRCEATCS